MANASGYCELHQSAAKWYEKYPVIFPREKGRRKLWYLSGNRQWLKTSKAYLEKYYFCARCKRAAVEVDHIRPVSRFQHLAFDENNFQSLCRSCHQHKTASLEPRGIYADYNKKTLHFDAKVKKI